MLSAMLPLDNADIPQDFIWRISLEQFHAMVAAGILTKADALEFLEGWLVCKLPKPPLQRATARTLRMILETILPTGWYVASQQPITLPDSEPEPDIVVVQGQRQDYMDCYPHADDVALVIEVSETTLQRDRTTKKRIYARAGIPVYWLVNLQTRSIEVYSQPDLKRADYLQSQDYPTPETILLTLAGRPVSKILVTECFASTV